MTMNCLFVCLLKDFSTSSLLSEVASGMEDVAEDVKYQISKEKIWEQRYTNIC